jgi:hypothetical protein
MTAIVIRGVMAGVPPFDATIVKAEIPTVVGVPDNSPVVPSSVSPGGNDPEPIEKVGVGMPDAANL